MKINKLNYENYVIDYIEGTLSIELKKDFDLFLDKNKEVYDEIKDYMSAPVYEETEEVFTNKKAVLQKNNTGKYALLAMIPILLIGAYFLLNNNTSQKIEATPTVEKESFENKEDTKTEVAKIEGKKKEVEKFIPAVQQEVKQVKEVKEIKKEKISKKKIKKAVKEEQKIEPTLNKSNFNLEKISAPSPSELRFAAADTPVRTTEKKEITPRAIINSPITIGNLDLRFDQNSPVITDNKMVIAEVETFNGSEDKSERKKNPWLEMITPAAFEDLDLRESLAIQSNENIDTRKIINAFIPESVAK